MNSSTLFKTFALILILATALLGMVACGPHESSVEHFSAVTLYEPDNAVGFTITTDKDSTATLITTLTPWQGADSVPMHLLVVHKGKAPADFDGCVVNGYPRRIVAMSSTHVAFLDALDATDRIVGVSGKRFIANEAIHKNNVAEVGNEQDVDFETIVAINPDLVLIYGVNCASPMASKLEELGIPYVYIGDYLEESPLGKLEWVVPIGEIIGASEEAYNYYMWIKNRYESLSESARNISTHPKVMINMPYNDTWFMPSADNYMVRLITDAGGDYILGDEVHGTASINISDERAYLLASEADIWINPGQCHTLKDLRDAMPRFADLPIFDSGNIYNNNAITTPYGGNDFYESGTVRPDIIISDLMNIFLGETGDDDHLMHYYKRLK